MSISETSAIAWSVFGAVLSYATLFLLPELTRQLKIEHKKRVRFRPTTLSWIVGVLVLMIAIGAGVGVVVVVDPCSRGDAWLCGLGSVAFLSGILGTVSAFDPRGSVVSR